MEKIKTATNVDVDVDDDDQTHIWFFTLVSFNVIFI